MKNYFNEKERTYHILLMSATSMSENFSKSEALTSQEKAYLLQINEMLDKFNKSVFNRFGEPYKRKVVNTMNANTLRLVGKYENYKSCISECATEDLKSQIEMLRTFNCFDCEKAKFTDCAIYGICTACEIQGQDNGKCPYSLD